MKVNFEPTDKCYICSQGSCKEGRAEHPSPCMGSYFSPGRMGMHTCQCYCNVERALNNMARKMPPWMGHR